MRIASLLSSSTEMLFALGLGEQVVAVSHECDHPPQVRSLPRVTRTRVDAESSSREIDEQVQRLLKAGEPLYEVDERTLASLRPDLIVTQAQCDVCAVRYEDVLAAVARQPELRGATVMSLNPMSLADVLQDIRRVATAAGVPERGEQFAAWLHARIERVEHATGNLPSAERVSVCCLEWLEPPMVAGNWMPEMIRLSGGEQRLSRGGEHSPYVTWEQLSAWDPQAIVVMPCGFDLERTLAELPAIEQTPQWRKLSAVRGGRVFAVDGNAYFNRSGPRLADSLELLAHLLHPDLVARPREATWRVRPAPSD